MRTSLAAAVLALRTSACLAPPDGDTHAERLLLVQQEESQVFARLDAEDRDLLETLLGGPRATTFVFDGDEYDVRIAGRYEDRQSPLDMNNIFVRSERSGQLIPMANLITIEEFADSSALNRYNRLRAITFDCDLAEGYSLGEALAYLEDLIRTELPGEAVIGYKGNALKLRQSSDSMGLIFGLALLVGFLMLAAQFESFIHPLTIMLTVPVAVAGALLGLQWMGLNQSIYSQIGLIMLIGLAAKNGILIVEFINQLRDDGVEFMTAVVTASEQRLRTLRRDACPRCEFATPRACHQDR